MRNTRQIVTLTFEHNAITKPPDTDSPTQARRWRRRPSRRRTRAPTRPKPRSRCSACDGCDKCRQFDIRSNNNIVFVVCPIRACPNIDRNTTLPGGECERVVDGRERRRRGEAARRARRAQESVRIARRVVVFLFSGAKFRLKFKRLSFTFRHDRPRPRTEEHETKLKEALARAEKAEASLKVRDC